MVKLSLHTWAATSAGSMAIPETKKAKLAFILRVDAFWSDDLKAGASSD